MEKISFEDALLATAGVKRHLLLGNGFSIALFPDRFSYSSLLGQANFGGNSQINEAFEAFSVTDFEHMIDTYQRAATLVPIYSNDEPLISRLVSDADIIKDRLAHTIAGHHPARPHFVTEAQFNACHEFLARFVGQSRTDVSGPKIKDRRGKIYTTNYDLLLYWVLMHRPEIDWSQSDPVIPDFDELQSDDGFRAPRDASDSEFVLWESEGYTNKRTVHYLHGALHVFDMGAQLKKLCWERCEETPLVDQIRTALYRGDFPLFVSEGSSNRKLQKIRHHAYLQSAYKSFAEICRSPNAALFIYGQALGTSDHHIWRLIGSGKVPKVYLSVYGSPSSSQNEAMLTRGQYLASNRSDRFPLDIRFFDASEAQVWG